MKHKVLIADSMSGAAIDRFYKNSIATVLATEANAAELAEMIGEFHGLAVRSRTQVTEALLRNARCLRVVGRAGIGIDNIDVDAATRQGVVVMNTPDGNATTTAEHTIAMMMAMARHIPAASASTHQGLWEKSKFTGTELAGKTLGIVGCGKIGSIVADRAHGLQMAVVVFDPFLSVQQANALNVSVVSLDELLRAADVVTLHVPLNAETRDIINARSLAKMKPGARIINCARGGLVNEEDLAKAIRSGRIAGAAIDVFSTEPARENVLFGLPNVVLTPHLGASTDEAQEKVAVQLADQMSAYLRTGVVKNAVNIPSLSNEESKRVAPSLELGKQLGTFAAQLVTDRVKSAALIFEGQMAEMNTPLITRNVLAALLAKQFSNVNVVNVIDMARHRDIDVSETRRDFAREYQTLLELAVCTETDTIRLRGTLYADNKARIVGVQGIRVEFEFVPQMLYLVTHDKPGVIGAVGSVLAEANVNISTLHMGRASRGGDAIALFGLDGEIAVQTLERVRALSSVRRVELITNDA